MSRSAASISDITEMPAPLQQIELDPVALRKMQPMPHPHDVIDNNPDTRPHLAPYTDDSAPELPSPATYNPNPASLPTTLVAMLENILAVSNTQKGSAETVIKSLEITLATKQREALQKEQLQGEYIESVGWYDYMKKTCRLPFSRIFYCCWRNDDCRQPRIYESPSYRKRNDHLWNHIDLRTD